MVCVDPNKVCAGEAGNAISVLCTSHVIKNVLDGSAEPR